MQKSAYKTTLEYIDYSENKVILIETGLFWLSLILLDIFYETFDPQPLRIAIDVRVGFGLRQSGDSTSGYRTKTGAV